MKPPVPLVALVLLLSGAPAAAHVHPFTLDAATLAAPKIAEPEAICRAPSGAAINNAPNRSARVAAPVRGGWGSWVALGPFFLLTGIGLVRAWRNGRASRLP